jgi:dipeptidyl aminopeptidase/acylaminoacyl peptidase
MRLAHGVPVVALVGVLAVGAASESATRQFATGGSRLVFVSQTGREPFRWRATEIGAAGTRSVPLEGRFVGGTSFAPQGDFIAYSASTPQRREEATFLTRFGARRRVLLARSRCRPAGFCTGHSHGWSRDARKLVLSVWDGSRSRLFVIDRPSGRRREITPRGTTTHDNNSGPSWSPNGRLIGFVRHYGLDDTNLCCKLEYHVMRPDGSGRRWVYRHRRGDTAYDSLNFAWAPGSRRLAFTVAGRGGYSALGIVDLGTRRLRWLHAPGPHGGPAWSRDSRWIAVAAFGAGITLVDPAGRERPRRLVPRLAVWDVAFAADGRSLIATVATGSIGSSASEIRIVPLDGGPAQALYRAPRGWSIVHLEAWPAR